MKNIIFYNKMTKPKKYKSKIKYLTKRDIKRALGLNFDDEGFITLDIDDINVIIEYYLEYA